jgi:hypothetical protein
MEVKTITSDGFFRVFTACPQDPKTFILDVRSHKEFAKQHIMQAYSIRLAANGKALLVRIRIYVSSTVVDTTVFGLLCFLRLGKIGQRHIAATCRTTLKTPMTWVGARTVGGTSQW